MTRGALMGIVGGLLLAGGCGERGRAPEFTIRDAQVVVESSAPFASQPDFPARIESTIGAALQYWGGGWADLAGYEITVTDAAHVACGGSASALGCHEGRTIRFTTQDPAIGTFACVEQSVLVHEIGHAVIGDPNHQDPRWMEMDAVAAELSGRVGYGAAGEQPCVIYPSVWRHLLGVP